MTIQMLYEKIRECLNKLNKTSVFDESVFDLELLVMQLRIRLHAGVYDPLKKLYGHNASELSSLLDLTDSIDEVLEDVTARGEIIAKVAMLAKNVLKKEGIPFRA